MHFADSSRSCGIPLSGVSIISLKTWAALWVRVISSSRSDATANWAASRTSMEKIRKRFSINISSFAVEIQFELVRFALCYQHSSAELPNWLQRVCPVELHPEEAELEADNGSRAPHSLFSSHETATLIQKPTTLPVNFRQRVRTRLFKIDRTIRRSSWIVLMAVPRSVRPLLGALRSGLCMQQPLRQSHPNQKGPSKLHAGFCRRRSAFC